jgi:toxoflavin biosynthesis protein ToxD
MVTNSPIPCVAATHLLPSLVGYGGGPARIGSNNRFADETPIHLVDVPPFAIGVHPVTHEEYGVFLAESDLPPTPYWCDPCLNHPDQPVVGVTAHAAMAYCVWLTKRLHSAGILPLGSSVRLPTEAEWEIAASWDPERQQQRRYPWGKQWDSRRAVTTVTGSQYPLPIGGRPRSASAIGAQDMLGNIWEWTSSIYTHYPGAAAPFTEPDRWVIRGGSCVLRPTHLCCSFRCRLPPQAWRYHLGFRIVVVGA